MAKNPANGNFDHGYSGRQEFDRALVPPDNMWTNPVARIMPAANALRAMNRLPSVLRNFLCFPTSGIAIPRTPAIRMQAMATSLSLKAVAESLHEASRSFNESQSLVEMESVIDRRKNSAQDRNKKIHQSELMNPRD